MIPKSMPVVLLCAMGLTAACVDDLAGPRSRTVLLPEVHKTSVPFYVGPTVRITTDPANQGLPKIDGDLIVWEDERNGNVDIYMYDLATGQELPVTTNPAEQRDAHVSGNRVVWQDKRSGNWDVWMYDVGTGQESQISDDPGDEIGARISGDRIVWEGDIAGGQPDEAGVFLHDLSSGVTSLLQREFALDPEIDGDRIVSWWHCPRWPFRGVCLYDITTGETRSISPPEGANDRGPVISGHRIVWARDWPVRDIVMYDLSTEQEIRITDEPGRDHHLPRISGDLIVWVVETVVETEECWSTGGADVMMYSVSTGATRRLVCGMSFRADVSGHRVVFGAAAPAGPADDIYMIELVLPVDIDIKPGGDPNSINCSNDREVITVAILTTPGLDATTVDHSTVTFQGASESHIDKRTGELRRHEEDVDGDGDIDLVLHFRQGDTDLTCSSTEGVLSGKTFDGQPIQGTDAVRMVGESES